MRKELENVINEILRCKQSEVDPALLHPRLQKSGYLTLDEVAIIKSHITPVEQTLKIFQFLKQKDEAVFTILQQISHDLSYEDFFNLIQKKLKEAECTDLILHRMLFMNTNLVSRSNKSDIFQLDELDSVNTKEQRKRKHSPSSVSDGSDRNKLETVCQSLKVRYKDDLELIEIKWQKFNVTGVLEMDVFYNQNIIIEDKMKRLKVKVENFDHLFSTNRKRIIITADAGYGKSTFVHEMARQWVKGESHWTKKFSFVFLIILSEVGQNETQSLQSLLMMCFNTKDALVVSQWLEDSEHMEKCLFIFDGLDELRQEFCEELNNLIFGRRVQHAHVVITTRPYKNLMEKFETVSCNNLYIELNGYTEIGANRQLEKFEINPNKVGKDLRDILKVPLFNTLFCITHKEATIGCLSICTAIEKFVNFACSRHRNSDPNFTEIEEDELKIMLGQAAQNKFSLMKDVNIRYPNVTKQQLSTAISSGLVSKKSTNEDFVFAHQTIAEYCAAYFWVKKSHLKLNDIKPFNDYVVFAEPKSGGLKHTELFSCFLSHLNNDYKQFLWQNFKECVPLFDEYDSLPKRRLMENSLDLKYVPLSNQNTVMDKIEVLTKTAEGDSLSLFCANFESGKQFQNITKMKHLIHHDCSFKISSEEFFYSYNINYLHLDACTFNYWDPVGEDLKLISNNYLFLEHLHIEFCDFTVVIFLSFIMRHCKTLKTFIVANSLEYVENEESEENIKDKSKNGGDNFRYFGNCWISELQNNEKLLHSVENFALESCDPFDLTVLFETLGKMVNLKTLVLIVVERNLTKAEINSLKLSLENGWKKLEDFDFDVKDNELSEINEKGAAIILGKAVCDGCLSEQLIENVRFRCFACKDFNLCENCHKKSLHIDHQMGKYISTNNKFWRKTSMQQ